MPKMRPGLEAGSLEPIDFDTGVVNAKPQVVRTPTAGGGGKAAGGRVLAPQPKAERPVGRVPNACARAPTTGGGEVCKGPNAKPGARFLAGRGACRGRRVVARGAGSTFARGGDGALSPVEAGAEIVHCQMNL